jgi:hypothetical protein
MPPKHLLKDPLPIPLNNIAMARDNALKVPLINPRNRLRKPLAITSTSPIPDRALLPNRRSLSALQRSKDLRQNTGVWVDAGFAELLCGREVEHEICGDEGAGGFVVEDEFFVDMCGDVLPVELCVEFWRDGLHGLGFAEEEGERHVFVLLFGSLLWEGFWAHDLCLGVLLVPWSEEDVVLEHVNTSFEWICEGRRTSASNAAMYLTSPSSATLRLTSSVSATGEKTARAPDCRRTTSHVSSMC